MTKILEEKPDRKLFIADDRGLPITKVISTRLPVSGYTISSRGSEALESTSLPVSRALVVKGMKKNMILVSTRGMKRDGINTYLNDDNSNHTAKLRNLTWALLASTEFSVNH